jgi:ABC-2 type transport system permease protein
VSSARGILAIGRAELRMLLRNKAVAAVAILMPLGIGLYAALSVEQNPGGAGAVAGLQVLVMLGVGVYTTATTTLASRRKDLFLKRLRSGALPDAAILAGLLLPLALVAILQVAIILGVLAAVTGTAPGNIGVLVAGAVCAALMCIGVAMATSAVTVSAEQAQVTSVPFLIALLAGGIWVSSTGMDEFAWVKRVAPGGAVSEVISGAWAGVAWSDAMPGLLALLLWAAAGATAGSRFFRWEPRH